MAGVHHRPGEHSLGHDLRDGRQPPLLARYFGAVPAVQRFQVGVKGGDFQGELDQIGRNYRVWELSSWFDDEFFGTKKVVWVNMAT